MGRSRRGRRSTMGFEQYRKELTAFDRYYDKFLLNAFQGKTFKITLVSGEAVVGTPMAGSMANPVDPDVFFFFRSLDGRSYRIPFRDLASAEMEATAA